jgi:Domain of unknown function (DUF4352)
MNICWEDFMARGNPISAIKRFILHRPQHIRDIFVFGITLLVLYVSAMCIVSLLTPQQTYSLGQQYCVDKSCLSVVDVARSPAIGFQEATRGTFYIVSIQMRNNSSARATPNSDSFAFYLVDAVNNRYDISAEGERAQNDSLHWADQLDPGDSQTHVAVFDVPPTVQSPSLIITDSNFFSGFIIGNDNSLFHPKTKFALTR